MAMRRGLLDTANLAHTQVSPKNCGGDSEYKQLAYAFDLTANQSPWIIL